MPVYEEDLYFEGVFHINQVGRVFTILIENNYDKFINHIQKFNPLFIQEIDVDLEELFINSQIRGQNYEQTV